MKKFIPTLALTAVLAVPSFGQQTTPNEATNANVTERTTRVTDRASEVTADDYDRMYRNYRNVQMRATVIQSLQLSPDEIEGFTPLFLEYTAITSDTDTRRRALVAEYRDEMAEDDTAQDERNETADFVENYWELDIDQQERFKDLYDRLEDEIGPLRALEFFNIAKRTEARMDRARLLRTLPDMVMIVPEYRNSYDRDLRDFSDWNRVSITGKVSLDHEYTKTGLTKLVTVAEKMATSEGITVPNLMEKKKTIMKEADAITRDWKSMTHANSAREAFLHTADLLGEIARDSRFTVEQTTLDRLRKSAESINVNRKLTDQADAVYRFFGTAEMIVNQLADQAGSFTAPEMDREKMMKRER